MTSAMHLPGGDLLPEQAPSPGAAPCAFPGCPTPGLYHRPDTRRSRLESLRVCFEHRRADLGELPPLREGNAGPVAATLAMMVVEHPEGWPLRDAGRALGVLPSEVGRVARELGLPVMHGRVWPAPGTATRTVEPARCRECSRPALSPDGLCVECHEARLEESFDYEDLEDDLDEDGDPEDWQDEDWTGHPDLGADADPDPTGYRVEAAPQPTAASSSVDEADASSPPTGRRETAGAPVPGNGPGQARSLTREPVGGDEAPAAPPQNVTQKAGEERTVTMPATKRAQANDEAVVGYVVAAGPAGCRLLDIEKGTGLSNATVRRVLRGHPDRLVAKGSTTARRVYAVEHIQPAKPRPNTRLRDPALVLAAVQAADPSVGLTIAELATATGMGQQSVRRCIDELGNQVRVVAGAGVSRPMRVYPVQQSPAPRPPPPPEVQEGRYVAEGPGALGDVRARIVAEAERLDDELRRVQRERDRMLDALAVLDRFGGAA